MAESAGVDVGVTPFTSPELMDSLEGLACVQGGLWICRDLVRQRNRGFQCLARLD